MMPSWKTFFVATGLLLVSSGTVADTSISSANVEPDVTDDYESETSIFGDEHDVIDGADSFEEDDDDIFDIDETPDDFDDEGELDYAYDVEEDDEDSFDYEDDDEDFDYDEEGDDEDDFEDEGEDTDGEEIFGYEDDEYDFDDIDGDNLFEYNESGNDFDVDENVPVHAHIDALGGNMTRELLIGGKMIEKKFKHRRYPFLVRLNGCGGSIIGPRTIVTAAHCFTCNYDKKEDPKSWNRFCKKHGRNTKKGQFVVSSADKVRIGLYNQYKKDPRTGKPRGAAANYRSIPICPKEEGKGKCDRKRKARVFRHPVWKKCGHAKHLRNDIAIIILPELEEFWRKPREIIKLDKTGIKPRERPLLLGWGIKEGGKAPQNPRRGKFKPFDCPGKYKNHKEKVCLWNRKRIGCPGDSGSPLIVWRRKGKNSKGKKRPVLVAVDSSNSDVNDFCKKGKKISIQSPEEGYITAQSVLSYSNLNWIERVACKYTRTTTCEFCTNKKRCKKKNRRSNVQSTMSILENNDGDASIPTFSPTSFPTFNPTEWVPTFMPTVEPTVKEDDASTPTDIPTIDTTSNPTSYFPTVQGTYAPTLTATSYIPTYSEGSYGPTNPLPTFIPTSPFPTLMPTAPTMASNILEIASANDDFSLLVQAVSAAPDVADLLSGDGPFTVFAPNNAAFEAIGTDDLNLLLEDTERLQGILNYHVLSGKVMAADVAQGMVETLNGAAFEITVGDDGSVRVNDANVIATDIEASNGVIHAIDAVLIPPDEPQGCKGSKASKASNGSKSAKGSKCSKGGRSKSSKKESSEDGHRGEAE